MSWLHAFTVAAALTSTGATSACIRIGYDPVEPARVTDDAKPPEPPVDSGAGSLFDADMPQPPSDAGSSLPDDATTLLPEDAAARRIDDAGATPPDDDDAGTTQPDDDAGLPRDCGTGVLLADACWYLGTLGASCAQVCESHGGYIAEPSYVGVAAEGGTLARCDMLLDLLVGPGETMSGTRADGMALGCHLYEGVRWWLNSGPLLDPLVSERFAQLVCSCNGP